MKPVRVLQMVAPASPGPDGHRGVNGPELRTLNAFKLYDPEQVRLTLTYTPSGRLWPDFEKAGAHLIDFYVKSKTDWRSEAAIMEIIRQHEIEVLHTQGPGSLDLFATRAARRTGRRIVITRPVMIADLQVAGWRRQAYNLIDQYTLKRADAIITVATPGRDHLRDVQGVPAERLHLIFNGVNLDRFAPASEAERQAARATWKLPPEALVLGMCAQLTNVKGWPDFLEAIARLRQQDPRVYGMVIGDGPLHAELAAWVAERQLTPYIVFTGHQSAVQHCLRCLDLYLFMSHREGLSVAIIEALACGLPCVITDVGGAADLVLEGHNGHIIPARAIDQAVARVQPLLADGARRQAMGAASRTLSLERFEARRMVRQYQNLYLQLAGRQPATAS